MPIRTHAGLIRMCKLGGTFIPPKILEDLEPIKDNDQAVQDYGIPLASLPCPVLLACPLQTFTSSSDFHMARGSDKLNNHMAQV